MEKPEVVQRYEELIRQSDNIYLDPVEIEDIYRYYAEREDADALGGLLRVGQSLYPDEPIVRQLDAEYELNTGSAEKALEKIDLIFTEENPYLCILRSAALARLNRLAEAMDMAEAARYDEQPDEFITYDVAVGFMSADQYPTAVHYFDLARKAHPNDVRTLNGLLYCHTRLGHIDELPELAEQILQADPYNYDAWMAKGNCLSKKDQWEEAIEAYDYATAICPDECDPIVLKALCLNLLNRADESEALLREAADKAHGWALATICYEIAKRQIKRNEREEAIAMVWRGLSDSSTYVDSLLEASKLFRQAGDLNAAISMQEAVKEADPENEMALVDLAELYSAANRHADACCIYKQLTKIKPQAAYYALWGSSLLSNQEYDRALNKFRKANELEEMWQTYVLMTVCSYELKRPEQTKQYFALAYAANPDHSLDLLKQITPELVAKMDKSGYIEELQKEFIAILKREEERLLLKSDNK